MRKVLILLGLVTIVYLGISCKKDEDSMDVVGKWRKIGEKVGDLNLMIKCDSLSTLDFKSDGTLVDYDHCTGETATKTYSAEWWGVNFDDTKYDARISGDSLFLWHTDWVIIPVSTIKTYLKVK